jgi:type IV pilus assembly protein PilM
MASFLNNIFKKISSKPKKSVLGIDVGSASLKIVQLRKEKGKAILETYGEIALGPYAKTEIGRATKLPPEKIAEALKDVMKEASVSTIDSAMSIPMRHSMVSVIKLPQMQERQIAQMVPIEARKYIPVPMQEVTLDWFTIPKIEGDEEKMMEDKEGKKAPMIEVLTVAIHNDVLSNFSSIVTSAQLETSFFEVEMFSTIRSVINMGENNVPVMIFDMGASATKIYVVERGVLRESHIVNKGSQDITLNISKALGVDIEYAEKLKRNFGNNTSEQDQKIGEIVDLTLGPILSQTNATLLNYGRRYNKVVSKMIMVGGGCLLNGIVQKANEKIGIKVEAGDPFFRTETPAFLQDILKQSGLAFSTALGLAIRKLQELE